MVLCPRCQEYLFWMIGVTNFDCREKCARDYMTAVEECWLLDMLATSARVFLTANGGLKLDTSEVMGSGKTSDVVGGSRDAVPAREHRSGPKETSV